MSEAAGSTPSGTFVPVRAAAPVPVCAPPVELAGGPLGLVQAADREIARQTAIRARAVAAFAAARPASVDRPQGIRGAMSPERWAARADLLRNVSDWAMPELSVALSISQAAADHLLLTSLTLVHRLPSTLAALEAGTLHAGHVRPLIEQVATVEDAAIRAEVERSLLRWTAGRVTTPAQLRDKARREVLRRDARAAARRLERAIAERGVCMQPDAVEGMASVSAFLTVPEARALYEALGAYADALPADPDDRRSRSQKMADCLLDLVLRPGETDQPPVQVLITLVASVATALGGDAPGELDGHVVPAETVRALLRGLAGNRESAPPVLPSSVAANAFGPPASEPNPLSEDEPPGEELSLPERLALERYWADLERRILADEMLGPEPLPTSEELQASAEARIAAEPELADDLLPESQAWQHDPDPPDTPVSGQAGDGWWGMADRAVAEAGQALFEAQSALGHARRLVDTAARADAADEAAWRDGPGGRVTAATDSVEALAVAAEEERAALGELLARTGGGGLAERPRLALAQALTGTLLALTDLPGLRAAAHCGARGCRRRPDTCTHSLAGRPGLGPPPPTEGYRPSAPLDRFVRARDRRCRFPGCRRRVPKGGELDHDVRYPEGPTAGTNLTGYCTPDHRGKHQAPGWQHELSPDGTLTVTTPSGLAAVTTPAPY